MEAASTHYVSAGTVIAEIDPATHTAAALPVRTLPPPPPSAAVTGPSKQLVTGHSVSLERVLLRVESDAPGYLQISYPWYPDTQVLVNGQEVVPLRGAFDLIVLALQQGTNEIEVRPSTTPLRRGVAGLSCLALLVTLALAFAMHRRRERYATA